jgi:hypothetical protein
LYDKVRWKRDNIYILQDLPNIDPMTLYPTLLPLYLCTPAVAPVQCPWRVGTTEFGDELGGLDHANFQAIALQVCRYTWRL